MTDHSTTDLKAHLRAELYPPVHKQRAGMQDECILHYSYIWEGESVYVPTKITYGHLRELFALLSSPAPVTERQTKE